MLKFKVNGLKNIKLEMIDTVKEIVLTISLTVFL